MQNTYKAVEVASPGKLNLVTRPVPEPGPRQVRVRVEAAGICHSDVATVEAVFPGNVIPGFPDTRLPVTSKRSGKMLAAGRPGSAWELDGLEVNVDIVNLVEEEILLTART